MDLSTSPEQRAVRELFADFFADQSPTSVVRAAEPLGFSLELWTRLVPTGALSMALPESAAGGAGAGELVIAAEELGRRLAPVPLIEAVTAIDVLAAAGVTELLAKAIEGDRISTVALHPADATGKLRLVPAGAVATLVVALVGDELVALERAEPPAQAPNFAAAPIADWTVEGSYVHRLASGLEARELHERTNSLWRLLTAAALNGLRRSALEIALEYVKSREAFGVQIGWFQAVQHRLADLSVSGDGAGLLIDEAAWARDTEHPEARSLAAMAFLFASEVAFTTARESLQFHGGYGYTLEYDIQLYYRRAKAWPLILGDPSAEYRALSDKFYV